MRKRVLPERAMATPGGVLALVGGPAGAGKTTLAAAWCAERPRAAHLQLGELRELIVSDRADPRQPGLIAAEQYTLSARACLAVARVFLATGYDVAIDDVFEPEAFAADWLPLLYDLDWRLVILHPAVAEALARAAGREKLAPAEQSRAQHVSTGCWAEPRRLDTTGLSVAESLALPRRGLTQ